MKKNIFNIVFTFSERKHHCRQCGNIFCDSCSGYRYTVRYYPDGKPRRICDTCNKSDPAPQSFYPTLTDEDEDDPIFWDRAKGILSKVDEITIQLSE